MTADKILKTLEEDKYKFVDLRFVDTMGKEQHVSLPISAVDEDLFEEGKMFDGSSISGWKGINESDMVLMPDPETAVKDPFAADKTLIVRCDVLEPNTMEGYNRCPRSLAKRAEAYLKSSGIADTAFFGPEPELCSTMCATTSTCTAAPTGSTLRKATGIPAPSTRAGTSATAPP